MILLCEPQFTKGEVCPYLFGYRSQQAYFLADEVSDRELEDLLSGGWRKFGTCFFRPSCETCKQCIPLRVPVNSFSMSKSQRRIVKKNENVVIEFKQLRFTEEIFKIYEEHSRFRFSKEVTREEMFENFYNPPCETVQSEYFVNGELAAVGYLDKSSIALSSVYFIYSEKSADMGLGNLSILKEIEYAKTIGLSYYYLGYFVKDNTHMAYKGRFFPHERFDWDHRIWNTCFSQS